MRTDPAQSRFHEEDDLSDFNRAEKKHGKYLLRRLRFLETRLAQSGGVTNPANSSAIHMELELEALEWALVEIGFIKESESV